MHQILDENLISNQLPMTIEGYSSSKLDKAKRIGLIIHRYFPGQFTTLIEVLAKRGSFRLFGLRHSQGNESRNKSMDGYFERIDSYDSCTVVGGVGSQGRIGDAFETGRSVAAHVQRLKTEGIIPDLIVCPLGWGESIHIRSVCPDAIVVGYCEFFHQPKGVDTGFDPEYGRSGQEVEWTVRELNAVELLGFQSIDIGITPTCWQKSLFPAVMHHSIRVIHEGIDTEFFSPDPNAEFMVPHAGHCLTRGDKVVTFATSSLEPYRGIHVFLRSLPKILHQHPDCHVVIAGSESGPRYGNAGMNGKRLIEALLAETGLSRNRIHFVGLLERSHYRSLLQVSSCHIYLTVPFVLSWSLIEAMSTGCKLVASSTAPVLEVLDNDKNALLVDFFEIDDLAEAVCTLLNNPDKYEHLSVNARNKAIDDYDVHITKAEYGALINELTSIPRLSVMRPQE